MTLLQDGSDLQKDPLEESEIAPFAPGYLLANRWKIIERIGKGGFGFVYSVVDTELEGTVAIKVLRPEHETSQETIQRFKQEIQLARQVTHRNVCRIYDVGFYEQGKLRISFLSMELLAGQPLDERLHSEGPLRIEEIEVITLQVAAALEAAHHAGIVHADLKPANIMVDGEGSSIRAVVADFGLASAHATASRKGGESRVVGTPAYMAPEQVEGKVLGPAADFYALGCTLYQLISGHLPFHADTPVTTARARLLGPPPSLGEEVGKKIHTRWIHLVRDLMKVDPTARLASAPQIRKRLRKPKRARTLALSAIALALLASLSSNFFIGGKSETKKSDFVLSLPSDPETLRLYDKGLEQWRNLDLKGAVATWQGAIDSGHKHARLYIRLCDALREMYLNTRRIQCLEDAYQASRGLSADEQRFYEAYRASAQSKTLEASGSLATLLEEHPENNELRLLLAKLMRGNREYQGALEILGAATTTSPEEQVRITAATCRLYIEMMNFDKAIEVASAALPQARELKMRREELLLLDGLAHAYQNLGNLDETESLATETAAMAKEVGFVRIHAQAVSHLSVVAIKRGQFTRAMELVELREKLLEGNNNAKAANQMSITRAENMAATGRPEQAYELLTKVTIPNLRKDENTYWEAYAKVARAGIQRSLGRFDAAIEDCSSGASLFRSIANYRLQSFAQVVCAETMLAVGRIEEARELLALAREIRTNLKLDLILLQNSLLDAELLLKEGKSREAFAIAKDVAEEYVRRKLPTDEVVALDLMARAALAMGDLAQASTAVSKARSIGTNEYLEMEIELRLTELLVKRSQTNESTTIAALKSLQGEANSLGYLAIADKIAAAVGAPPGAIAPPAPSPAK